MNIISSYQNNVLVRQCGEAVRNKEIDQKSRIKNKEEYHQPGDVDIIYSKNGKIEENKKKDKIIMVLHQQMKIVELIMIVKMIQQ